MTCKLWFTRLGEPPALVMVGTKNDCQFLAQTMGKMMVGQLKIEEE